MKILLKEAKELSELLYKNNINHIFLKGTALLLSNVFEDIGERMIGDIDFIIQHKMKKKIKKLLEKNNYLIVIYHLFKYLSLNTFQGMINKNKTMAIEPHTRVIDPKERRLFLIQKS